MTAVNVRGQFENYWSHGVVSRGMALGLQANGVPVTITDVFDSTAINVHDTLQNKVFPAKSTHGGPEFIVGGYPPQVSLWKTAGATWRGALTITESEAVPQWWNAALCGDEYDLLCFPSAWARSAFDCNEDDGLVVPHGIADAFLVNGLAVEPDWRKTLGFFHVCGAADYMERKGTPQLIEAFVAVFGRGSEYEDNAKLVIRARRTPELTRLIEDTGEPGLFYLSESDDALSPARMATKLASSEFCAVIQPSRAEAFGIVPCEARAVGLPVIMTTCAGHIEHTTQHDIVVEHGASRHINVAHSPNGLAPEVTVEAVTAALIRYMEMPEWHFATAQNQAKYLRESRVYTWESCTKKLAERIKASVK